MMTTSTVIRRRRIGKSVSLTKPIIPSQWLSRGSRPQKNAAIRLENPRERQALLLAERGWRVFPLHTVDPKGRCSCGNSNCARPGKHPRTSKGFHDGSNDPRTISEFWGDEPTSNIGIVTGGGLFVLDVDGVAGENSLSILEKTHAPLPRTLKIRTGRGFHLYFTTDEGSVPNSASRVGTNLDIRGDGGYVIGPSSRHASGVFYGPTKDGRNPVAKAPHWLVALARDGKSPLPLAKGLREPTRSPYGAGALRDEVATLLHAKAGRRNDTLNRSAFKLGQLANRGLLNEREIETALQNAARIIGLDEGEIGATIRSGFQDGFSHPRISVSAREERAEFDVLTPELALLGQTDADNAERYARRFGEKVMCTPGRGYLVYDGTRWTSDTLLKHLTFAEQTARQIGDEPSHLERDQDRAARARFAEQSCSKSALDRMCGLARSRLMVEDSKLDSDPWALNTQSGTIDLRTGILKAHDYGDRITKLSPVAFDPSEKCPQFLSFLRRALGNDESLINYIQKAIGYTITGKTNEQVLFLVQGPTKTGKSTFLNLFAKLLGDYGLNTPSETLLSKQYDNSIPSDIARLDGARMVTAIEVNWSRQIDEARVKSMTGGDVLTARHLYQNYFEFTPQFKLWFAVNDFPKARGTDGAFWERVRVLPFNVQIPSEDRNLDLQEALEREGPGILAWAVQGCLRWQSEGLGECAAVTEASAHWKRASDHVRKFFNDEVIMDVANMIQSSDLYARYRSWCEQHGEAPVSDKKFKQALESLDLTAKRTRTGTVWTGVKLRST